MIFNPYYILIQYQEDTLSISISRKYKNLKNKVQQKHETLQELQRLSPALFIEGSLCLLGLFFSSVKNVIIFIAGHKFQGSQVFKKNPKLSIFLTSATNCQHCNGNFQFMSQGSQVFGIAFGFVL